MSGVVQAIAHDEHRVTREPQILGAAPVRLLIQQGADPHAVRPPHQLELLAEERDGCAAVDDVFDQHHVAPKDRQFGDLGEAGAAIRGRARAIRADAHHIEVDRHRWSNSPRQVSQVEGGPGEDPDEGQGAASIVGAEVGPQLAHALLDLGFGQHHALDVTMDRSRGNHHHICDSWDGAPPTGRGDAAPVSYLGLLFVASQRGERWGDDALACAIVVQILGIVPIREKHHAPLPRHPLQRRKRRDVAL